MFIFCVSFTEQKYYRYTYKIYTMQNLTQKQQYLSKEILDQGYDPQQFQQYMLHNSNKQLDLNIWTIGEIKNIVILFKKSKNMGKFDTMDQGQSVQKPIHKKDNQDMEQVYEKKISVLPQNQDNIQQSMLSQGVNSSLYRHFKLKNKMNLPELYILTHQQKKNFQVKIRSYSKTVPTNIFQSSYVLYNVESTQGWSVKRRFTDFSWLHGYLRDKYDGLPIPPMPEKTPFRSFDERHIEHRMLIFERFLNMLVKIPQICSDSILQVFLRGGEQYFAQERKKLSEQLKIKLELLSQSNSSYSEIPTVYGNDLLLLDQSQIDTNAILFYKNYQNKLDFLGSQFNILIQDVIKISKQIFQISSTFQDLHTTLDKYNEGSNKGTSFMSVMQEYCNNMGMYFSRTAQFIKTNIYGVWNYESLYTENLLAGLLKVQKQRSQMSYKYKNAMMKVPDQGSQSFTNSLQPNQKIKQFQMAKQMYRIRLSQSLRQMKRYQSSQLVELSKQWSKSLRGYIRDISDLMISCTDCLTQAMTVGEGKKLVQVEYISKQKDKNKQPEKEKEKQEEPKEKTNGKDKGKQKDKEKKKGK